MRFLWLVPIVLIAGYVIARNHHRLRDLGIGVLVGSSLPPLPDLSNDDSHSDAHHDHGHGHGDRDHSSSDDSTHVDTSGHSY